MSFIGTLEIDNKKYTILNWNFHVIQQVDNEGRPTTNPGGGKIAITIESSSSTELLEWALSAEMTKSGKIIFQQKDSSGILKSFIFTDAYCIEYYEDYSSEGNSPMKIRISISAKIIKNGTAELKKAWNKTSLN